MSDTNPQREVRIGKVELRTVDGKPQIAGYAAVFNSLSEDLGGFREIIAPGAFTDSLKTQPDVKALVNHDPSLILGRSTAGTLRMSEDAKGLAVVIDPPANTIGQNTVESLRRGDMDQMSFAFYTLEDAWDMKKAPHTRTLLKAELIDVSVVTYPAYPETSVALRSLDKLKAKAAGTPPQTIAAALAIDRAR
jgi:HK97 family phage prohead protease